MMNEHILIGNIEYTFSQYPHPHRRVDTNPYTITDILRSCFEHPNGNTFFRTLFGRYFSNIGLGNEFMIEQLTAMILEDKIHVSSLIIEPEEKDDHYSSILFDDFDENASELDWGPSWGEKGSDPFLDVPTYESSTEPFCQTYSKAGREDDFNYLEVHYQFDDETPVKNLPITVTFENGKKNEGRLDAHGFKRFEYVPEGTARIEIGHLGDDDELVSLRESLKTYLDEMVDEVSDQSKKVEVELEKEGLLGKGMIYTSALFSGLYTSGKQMVKGAWDMVMALETLKNKATYTVYETLRHCNLDQLKKDIDLIEAKGEYLYNELQKAYEAFTLLADDKACWDMLVDFPERYFSNLHAVEKTRLVGNLGPDILLALVSGGTGTVASALNKSRYFSKAAGVIQKIQTVLKRSKLRKTITDTVNKRVMPKTKKVKPGEIDKRKVDKNKTTQELADEKGRKLGEKAVNVCENDPVNMVTGEVVMDQEDFTIPGRIPIIWKRTYGSQKRRMGLCGIGWETPADGRLVIDENGIATFYDGLTGGVVFEKLPGENAVLSTMGGAYLKTTNNGYEVTQKSGLTYHFSEHFNEIGELPILKISDAFNNTLSFVRDGESLTGMKDSSGRYIQVYSEYGRIRKMFLCDEKGEDSRFLVEYTYEGRGDLGATYDPLDHVYTYAYENHALIRHTNQKGFSFHYEYDDSGMCTSAYGDDRILTYHFRYEEGKTHCTNALHATKIYYYNDTQQCTRITDENGHTTCYEYDIKGNLSGVVDPLGRKTGYIYDWYGNPVMIERPDNKAITIEHDAHHHPGKITDASGNIWQEVWDENHRLLKRISPMGSATSYEYSDAGDLIGMTDAKGVHTRFKPDDFGNIIGITDGLGRKAGFELDDMGNVVKALDPTGGYTLYHYDAESRLTSVTKPSGKTVSCEYDQVGNLIHYQDEAGGITEMDYTGTYKPLSRKTPDGHTIQFEYNKEEQLIGVINEQGDKHTFQMGPTGKVVEEVDYWGEKWSYLFDESGQLIKSTNPLNRKTHFQYDLLGNLIEKRFQSGESDQFFYDLNGNLTFHETPKSKVKRIFDVENRLIEEIQGDQTVKSFYDETSNRIARISSHGNWVDYEYNEVGEVTSVRINGADTIEIERDENGFPLKEILSRHMSRELGYDNEGNLTSQRLVSSERPAIEKAYQYDSLGNLTQKSDNRYGLDQFTYDPAGQIVRHIDPLDRVKEFLYDPSGNLPRDRGYEERKPWEKYRKSHYNGYTDYFDKAGRLVEEERPDGSVLKLRWDDRDHLVGKRGKWIDPIVNTYDAVGRRTSKKSYGEKTHFVWDGDALLSDNPDEKGVREYVYYPGTFEPLAVIDSDGRILYYHNDPNGMPQDVTDKTGKVVWSAHFDTLGKIDRLFETEFNNPIRMQGQYADDDIGFYYNRHRYYNPNTNSFISQDPLGLVAGFNPFQYAPNIFGWVDPLGLVKKKKCKSAKNKEVFVRYVSEREAEQTKVGLIPKVQNNKVSRGAKWVSEKGKERNPRKLGQDKNYTHKIEMITESGTIDWLNSPQRTIDFENMIGGESKYTKKVIVKKNEIGSYGIGSDLLTEFNKKIISIKKTKL